MQIKNFNLVRSLERNTLSELYLARHVHENYYAKIRLYDQISITNEEIREAILQRLRNSYQMRHRNIVATLDYGVEGRYMYQVQENMDGGSLEDLLGKAPKFPPEISVFVLQEVLRGLHYAHSIGIFHGLLNPAKVLLSSNGVVKIDDFQFIDTKNTFIKQVQTRIKAKQQMYLAPEHLLGKEADYRCDLFSAGVLAYRMLTGKHPFLEENSEWTTMQIIACNPKLLFELDYTLPSEVEEVVEKMIEKELSKRLQNAEEALRILDSYVDAFGEIRSNEVLGSFLKKPQQSVEQLNILRAEEFLQQAAQAQLQEQWDRALVSYYRAQFLKPKDKTIENQIKEISKRQGYVAAESQDPKFLQLEQTLRSNPENIQILQRLASLAKSRGDIMKCAAYYKRILKAHPADAFALTQLRQLLQDGLEKDVVSSPADTKWVKWQNFYRNQQRPFWQRWSFLQGNASLFSVVLSISLLIVGLHALRLVPHESLSNASAASMPSLSTTIINNQKIDTICEQAISIYEQGSTGKAIEVLTKAPLPEKGPGAARARLLLARYLLQVDDINRAALVLQSIDIPSAHVEQKIAIFKMKAETYRQMGRYGHAIDQYINIRALPGVPAAELNEADSKIQALQNEALLNQ